MAPKSTAPGASSTQKWMKGTTNKTARPQWRSVDPSPGKGSGAYVAHEGVAGVLAVKVRLVGVVGRVQLLDGGEHFCTMQAGSPGRY